MEYFVVSDVHSFFTELQEALDKAGFDVNNENHIFVSLGDFFDRGNESLKCLRWVNSLPENRKIMIKGNHDSLMEEAIERRYFLSHDIHNGTAKTAYDLCTKENAGLMNHAQIIGELRDNEEYQKYTNALVDYAEIGQYVFTHGYIPMTLVSKTACESRYQYNENWRNASSAAFERARWYNGMECWHKGIRVPNHTVVCGHFHCSWGWSHLRQERKEWPQKNQKDWKKSFEPFIDAGIIAIDSCCSYSGFLNCIVLEVD